MRMTTVSCATATGVHRGLQEAGAAHSWFAWRWCSAVAVAAQPGVAALLEGHTRWWAGGSLPRSTCLHATSCTGSVRAPAQCAPGRQPLRHVLCVCAAVEDIDWRAYAATKGLTDKQQKIADKIRKREARVQHLQREIDKIKARLRCGRCRAECPTSACLALAWQHAPPGWLI